MRCCTLQSRPQCIVAAGEGGGGISRSKAALQGRRGEPCAMAACASSLTAFCCCCCCCWSVRFATNDERMRAKTPAPFAAVSATTAATERWGTAVGNERMCLSVSVVDRTHREVSLSLSCSSVDAARMTGVPCCCCCSWSLRACSSARQDQNASRAQTSTATHTHTHTHICCHCSCC